IGRLGHSSLVRRDGDMGAHSFADTEDGRLHLSRGIGYPRIQLGALNPHQSACHVKPHGMVIILHAPVNSVTGNSVLARQSSDFTVFDPAQPTLGGGPKRSSRPKPKIANRACTESVIRRVSFPNSTLGEVGDASFSKA